MIRQPRQPRNIIAPLFRNVKRNFQKKLPNFSIPDLFILTNKFFLTSGPRLWYNGAGPLF